MNTCARYDYSEGPTGCTLYYIIVLVGKFAYKLKSATEQRSFWYIRKNQRNPVSPITHQYIEYKRTLMGAPGPHEHEEEKGSPV
jgi:hypothetical protein